MTIGQRIAALRKQAGLSQEALAAQLNVSRQAIGKWEADAKPARAGQPSGAGPCFGREL